MTYFDTQYCDDFSTANPSDKPVEVFGRSGRAAREYVQGITHAKQKRTDLLGLSSDYDAGYYSTVWSAE